MPEPNPLLARDEPLEPRLADGQSVKIVGLGGVGSIVARYGAMLLASLAREENVRLVLIDGDAFEPKNAGRMFFSDCGNKAAVTCDELLDRFADTRLTLVPIEEYVTEENVDRLVHDGDVVLCTVDNHATRKLLSDFCSRRLDDVVLISAGNDGVGPDSTGRFRRGTYGNCQVYVCRGGEDASPSLTQYHPEIESPADRLPTDKSCTEALESTPQLLLANLAAASACLNAMALHLAGALHYSELAFDVADGLMQPLPFPAPQVR